MNQPRLCGIVHNAGSPGAERHAYLPLEELRAKVLILDVSARVTLTQIYTNFSDKPTSRAKYYFPVPANAAVCAFEMHASDGRVVTGISKERSQAQADYEQAITQGKDAGLLEFVTDDIFTISIGSVLAKQTVETKLVFVLSLMNDDNEDEIRFQLPMHVGERYGEPPPELATAVAPSSRTRIKITTDIQTSGRIQSVTSPSHSMEISETKYPTHLARPSRRRTCVKFRSQTFLDRDFVLVVHAEKLDSPRCFAELERGAPGKGTDTIAMQLTIVPKFNLPPIPAQEYLFVVDRSGSMSGTRIATASRTISILLRMLPHQNSTFNIFSFGSEVDGLFPQSVEYTQGSLTEATNYVDNMGADYGGTEICAALRSVLTSRNKSRPTAAFVLTDGEVYDNGETFGEVKAAVDVAPLDAPLRVFTLGIGNEVSSAMCEGIARAGNGVCLFAVNAESIAGKCARLLRAGRTPFVENVTIDWGIPGDHLSSNISSVNFSNQTTTSQTVRLRPPHAIQQSPPQVHDIHAGTRLNVFAILMLKKLNVPKEVTLRGQLDGGGGSFELTVPIRGVQLADSEPGLPLVHTLAASCLIQDLEEDRTPLPLAIGVANKEDIRKAAIVRLGEKYQLASRYTSFVAIDSGYDHEHGHRNWEGFRRQWSSWGPLNEGNTDARAGPSGPDDIFQALRMVQDIFSGVMGYTTNTITSGGLPGAWPESSLPSPSASGADSEEDEGYESAETFSTLSSLEGSADWSDWSASPIPRPRQHLSEEDAEMQGRRSPQFEPLKLAPEGKRWKHIKTLPASQPPAPLVKAEVVELVRLQLFDGSFILDDIGRIVGSRAVKEADTLSVDRNVWATALAVAFMTKQMGKQKELLDDLLIKALEFLRVEPDFNELVMRAMDLI